MHLISVVKEQKKRWSKAKNNSDLPNDIDLPNGVTLKNKKKQKSLPNIFSSLLMTKYSDAVEENNNKNTSICEKLNGLENSEQALKLSHYQKKNNSASKLLNVFDSEDTIHDGYDSESTVHSNNFSCLRFPTSEEYENTIGTVVPDSEYNSLSQAFLSRKSVNLKGRKDDTLPVLTEYLAEVIRSRLPNLLQEAPTWNLLYSLDQHGARLSTMYRLIENKGPCVVVLKNSKNEVFGAFISEPFNPSNRGFFGTPECFLWKADKYEFKKYSSTNLNQYFMLADPSYIAMGGGKGKFGLFLDEDVQYGYSSMCETFENELLTEEKDFECYGCEVWGFEY